LRIFASLFIKKVDLYFSFLDVSFSNLGMSVMLDSLHSSQIIS
jgi:hypothetical protein